MSGYGYQQTGIDWMIPDYSGGIPGFQGYDPNSLPNINLGNPNFQFPPGSGGQINIPNPFTGFGDWFSSLGTGTKWILLGGLGIVVFSYAMKYRAR